jgi:glycosyltransferase involved in cell wall biosynthesis
MFFSIVIPTYNPREWISTLLESISHNKCLDDIEVIISDDCSDEPFDDVIEKFTMLNIVRICNDKHCGFPRDGREHGAQKANGKWICFADQDDFFLDNVFDNMKNHILENDVHDYIACAFIKQEMATGETFLTNGLSGWTHGKFYEKKFWDEHDVHYAKVKYCEDTSLSTTMQCVLMDEEKTIHVIDDPVYVWCRRNGSLSTCDYFTESMPDYIDITLGVIVEYVEKHSEDEDNKLLNDFAALFYRTFLHLYFYLQTPHFRERKDKVLEAVLCARPYFDRFKKALNTDNQRLWKMTNNEFLNEYNATRENDYRQIPFIEQINFNDWLNIYF